MRDQLYIDNGLVVFGRRMVIPRKARKEVLKRLHSSHQGIERTKRRARQVAYWPGNNNDVETTVIAYEKCQIHQSSQQKEPLMYDPLPDRIFEDVSIDFFSYAGKDFLVYVDRKSGYPIVYKFNKLDTTTESVIMILRKTFSDVGVPRKLRSDGGPQFTSAQFRKFMQKWEIEHVKSSPHYPQANGHAEAAVKAMKKLIKTSTENGNTDTDDYHQALLEFRNTPKEGGLSPAQLVLGKPLRSYVPVHHSSFDPIWHEKSQEYDRKVAKNHLKSEQQYNPSACELKKLQIGTKVRLQNPIHKTWD